MTIINPGDSPSRSPVPEVPDRSPPGPSIDEQDITCSSSDKCSYWGSTDDDAPEVPEGFIQVAESKFPIRVKEFFDLFFSDDGINFQESFHRKCGDEEFNCTSWVLNENFEHTRNASFHHPTNPYFVGEFRLCQETQKYRVYRNCHLIVDTSKETSAAAGYFNLEGRWDVVEESNDSQPGCGLRVYTNVAFSKSSKRDGRVEQRQIRECTEAYATWIDLAHEVLKQKNLEKEPDVNKSQRVNHPPEGNVVYLCGFKEANEFLLKLDASFRRWSLPAQILCTAFSIGLLLLIQVHLFIGPLAGLNYCPCMPASSRPQNYTSSMNETTGEAATSLNGQRKWMEKQKDIAETLCMEKQIDIAETLSNLREAATTSLNKQIEDMEAETEFAEAMSNIWEAAATSMHGQIKYIEEMKFSGMMSIVQEAAVTSRNMQVKYLEDEKEFAQTMLKRLENEHGRVEGKLGRLKEKLRKLHVLIN